MNELLGRLKEIEEISDSAWSRSLDERKQKELAFHDAYRAGTGSGYANKKYYSSATLSQKYILRWIGENAAGRIFLDYACGDGRYAILAAKGGAKLAIGIDISAVSVTQAKQQAEREGVSANTYFVQADAEDTKLPASSIDRVICSGMLHHLDLPRAFSELKRVLRPGGKILAVEALAYNPLIKLYRALTPLLRTQWESSHILNLKDLRFAEKFFEVGNIRYWHLSSILATYAKGLLPALNALDGLLTKIPYLQRMAWMFSFELTKPDDKNIALA